MANVSATTLTSANLAASIKSARDSMRKDAGLNGDIDRIPQLAWLLFLKAFDNLERDREIFDENYRPVLVSPYRWRDWAADPNGPTGDDLLNFVNFKLLPHLRQLSGTGRRDSRDVLASVFRDTNNRMLSGYLLREVVDSVAQIDIVSRDDIHTMARVYESMLTEVRDAAGDSGEFYTPRPVIRFMVEQVDPQLGEIIFDPACGTGGFLIEALTHLDRDVTSVRELDDLHYNLRGVEKKSLPYLLGTMNLVLHGVGQPNIARGNALNRPINLISRSDKVDVVLTNPPFGGEEERSIQANFPADKRTSETAWLFLQLVMRQLKDTGRCAIVVPNGILFGGGVGAVIKNQLFSDCNLHTVVRLPEGVFAPYTDIPCNLLFFDKPGPTKETWFYQISPPNGRKKYSKTKPMRYEEFLACKEWWTDRCENENAWKVSADALHATNYYLELQNPNAQKDLEHLPPEVLMSELIAVHNQLLGTLEGLGEEVRSLDES